MTKLNVYLAGASSDMERCAALMQALHESYNVRVTFDWVAAMKSNPPEREQMRSTRRHFALKDRQALREADIFWLALPDATKSEGAFWELGYYQAFCDFEGALQMSLGPFNGLHLIQMSERIITLSTPDGQPPKRTLCLFAEIPCESGRDITGDLVVLNWIRSEAELLAERG